MPKIHVSGTSDEALAVPGTDARELISGLNPDGDGRTFYLKRLSLNNSHGSQVGTVELHDDDEGTVAASTTRETIICPANTTTIVEYQDGEQPYNTNLTAAQSDTNGTFAARECGAAGYLA